MLNIDPAWTLTIPLCVALIYSQFFVNSNSATGKPMGEIYITCSLTQQQDEKISLNNCSIEVDHAQRPK